MRRSRGLEIADWGRGTHKNDDVLVLVVAGGGVGRRTGGVGWGRAVPKG